MRSPRLAPMARRAEALRGVVVSLGLLVVGCNGAAESALPAHRFPATVFKRLSLGATTPTDVERLLGAPDERGADGAMTYHAEVTSARGARSETVTFRFERGVLSKTCRRDTSPR